MRAVRRFGEVRGGVAIRVDVSLSVMLELDASESGDETADVASMSMRCFSMISGFILEDPHSPPA